MKPQLSIAFLNIFFGVIFTYFTIRQVSNAGWGFFAYLLAALAAFDFGSGIRMLISYSQHMRKKGSK